MRCASVVLHKDKYQSDLHFFVCFLGVLFELNIESDSNVKGTVDSLVSELIMVVRHSRALNTLNIVIDSYSRFCHYERVQMALINQAMLCRKSWVPLYFLFLYCNIKMCYIK